MDVNTRPRDEHYVFSAARREEQYRCLSEAFDETTTGRLAEIGVGEGWRCLDVGCGNGSLARWLADRVGSTGSVLATDLHPIAQVDRRNVAVVEHDVRTDPIKEGSLDLIVVRLLLQHFPDRDAVLAKLARALKPGGWLQVDEFDTSHEHVLVAPSGRAAALYEKFLRAKRIAMRSAGGDPEWGRRVAGALQRVGLVDVDARPHVRTRSPGSPDLRLQENHTFQLRGALVAAGMTDEELVDLRTVMNSPSFRATSSVLHSVRARKERQP
jgi:SAM-dependent methyltransferase